MIIDCPKLVSIILLNYNNINYNSDCIRSILNQSYTNFEIIIVNNASQDWSIDVINSEFEREISWKLIIIAQPDYNLWFAGGNNFAMQFISPKSKYICLLNNDTVVSYDWLYKLVHAIEHDWNLWWVWSMIIDQWYEQEIKKFTKDRKIIANLFCDSVFHDLTSEEKQSTIRYTSVISGCSFLYKKEIIKIPFLSEYFAYWEDVWLSLNILSKWYKLAIVTDSLVSHFWSASFGKNPSFLKSFHWSKNQICNFIFYHKWFQLWILLPRFIMIQFTQLFLWYPLIRIRWKLKAIIRIIRHRNWIIKQKKLILSERITSNKDFYGQLSYKFTDELYFIQFSKFQKIGINYINLIIFYYLKIMKITFQS